VPDPHSMAGEQIADYVLRVNPNGKNVDYMMCSHWHSDHVGTPNWQSAAPLMKKSDKYYRSGFGCAAEKLVFAKALDRGWPSYDDPIPFVEGWDKELEHIRKLYAFLQERDGLKVEKFRLGARDQVVPLHGEAPGFSVFNLCVNGSLAMPDGSTKNVIAPYVRPNTAKINENALSLGMIVSYGPFRFYTAGDFSHGCRHGAKPTGGIEDDMAEACGAVDVAKINHHGCQSMSRKLVSAMKARCYVACVWDQLHVTSGTMELLSDRTLYPGDRTLFPTVMTRERMAEDAGKPWMKDVADAVKGDGAHVVLTVPAGGKNYTMTCLDAYGAGMKVLAEYAFDTTRKG